MGPGPRSDDDELTARVAAEREQVMLLRTRVASFIALTLLPFTVVFYLWRYHPDRVGAGVVVTLVCEVAIILLLVGMRLGWFERRAHLAMFLLMGVICNFGQCSLLQLSGGGARSDVFFPYFLIFFGMATIFPAAPRWTMVTSLALIVGYPISEWIGDQPLASRAVVVNTIRLVDYAFITVIGNRVVTGLFLRERRGQLEVERANQRLLELDRLKSDFFANISHELRTPLTLILAPLESLLATPGTAGADGRRLLETMHRNAARLLSLINDLLLLARLDAGRLEPRPEPVDVAEVCRQAVESMRPLAAQLGLTVELDERARPLWLGDREHLERVLMNLISNACKFSQRGGRVALGLAADAGGFTLTVRDEGVGIAPADLARIFDRFVQAESHAARRWAGTGIGLSIVKELVELHGGSITVESEPGRGATFRVRFPRSPGSVPTAASTRPKAVLPATEPPAEEAPRERPGPAPAGRPRLLVIEDNVELLDYLARELEPEFAVTSASDGHQGLALALATRPSLIVSDIMMPDLDGLELVRRLRADPLGRDVPVILLSARGDLATKLGGFAEGADDYVSKPFSLPELRARIRLQLRLRAAEARVVLSEKLATLGTVVAGVAHEVNNPLHFVRGNVTLLRRLFASSAGGDGDGARADALFQDLEVGLERLGNVTRQLVRLARSEPAPVEEVDLEQLVDLVLRVLAPQIGAGVRVVPRLELRVMRGASQELFQVLVNLVQNAIHAVGPAGRVTIESAGADGLVTLTVRDDGPGIPAEVIERVFDPFFTTKPAGQGTGLGLSIVQQLVSRRGGSVHVDSRAGAGSAFVVTLPQ